MKLGFFFNRHDPGSSWRDQQEPHFGPHTDADANLGAEEDKPLITPPPPKDEIRALPTPEIRSMVRNMSPRQMADWAHEMYLGGVMSWDEFHSALPAELHPDYNRTVGALTGQRAQPDKPRDMVKEWEDRLAFVRRYNEWDHSNVRRAERIVALLRRQDIQAPRAN